MHNLKPIVASNPDELAAALGLSGVEVTGWRVQHLLLKQIKAIVQRHGMTHAEIAKRAGTSRTRVTAILNDDIARIERFGDSHPGGGGLWCEDLGSEVR